MTLTYQQAESLFATARDKVRGKPLPGKETYLMQGCECYIVRYWDSPIVRIWQNGTYTVANCDYPTLTTHRKISEYAPVYAHSDDGRTAIRPKCDINYPQMLLPEGGLRVTAQGYPCCGFHPEPVKRGALYKVTYPDGEPPFQTDGKYWDLPTQADDGQWIPGEWWEEPEIQMCGKGLHLTPYPDEWGGMRTGCVVWHASIGRGAQRAGEVKYDRKIVVSKARLVRPITPGEAVSLGLPPSASPIYEESEA